jgi:hypothetical protein
MIKTLLLSTLAITTIGAGAVQANTQWGPTYIDGNGNHSCPSGWTLVRRGGAMCKKEAGVPSYKIEQAKRICLNLRSAQQYRSMDQGAYMGQLLGTLEGHVNVTSYGFTCSQLGVGGVSDGFVF